MPKPTSNKKYNKIRNGLNMKGSCKNNKCLGYQKDVWVFKGYGHFDFSRNSVGNVCP